MIIYEKAGYLATVNSSVFYKEYCIESSGQGTCTHLYTPVHTATLQQLKSESVLFWGHIFMILSL